MLATLVQRLRHAVSNAHRARCPTTTTTCTALWQLRHHESLRTRSARAVRARMTTYRLHACTIAGLSCAHRATPAELPHRRGPPSFNICAVRTRLIPATLHFAGRLRSSSDGAALASLQVMTCAQVTCDLVSRSKLQAGDGCAQWKLHMDTGCGSHLVAGRSRVLLPSITRALVSLPASRPRWCTVSDVMIAQRLQVHPWGTLPCNTRVT